MGTQGGGSSPSPTGATRTHASTLHSETRLLKRKVSSGTFADVECGVIGLPATQRLLSVGKRKHAERAKVLTGPFTLLDMLSVDPEQQGKGYGRLLLETKLEALDHERARCYLETSDERNVGYYRRFGFDLVHQFEISGVPVYGLLRTPR